MSLLGGILINVDCRICLRSSYECFVDNHRLISSIHPRDTSQLCRLSFEVLSRCKMLFLFIFRLPSELIVPRGE